MPALEIRTAKATDVDAIAQVLGISFYQPPHPLLRLLTQWFHPLVRWGIAVDLGTRLQEGHVHHLCLVAVQTQASPQVIAVLEVSVRQQFWVAPMPYLYNLAVAPPWRGQGVGDRLMLAAEKVALSWGYPAIYLHVLESNRAALNLYRKRGYVYLRPDPQWQPFPWRQGRRLLLKKSLQ
ncbi:MAG: GNAT family N-acetyltransferase [Oscillatoriales cyanobacterium SM2_2_1]|nr:GNAT family N-acetyltransferase [Oscillatoriales cyanobacterium SM2_2_1]